MISATRPPSPVPQILGIVNITDDSFSDGGKYREPAAAIAHAEKLLADGADLIDLGPAASNPDARTVSAEEEIRRLEPVIAALKQKNTAISIDSFLPQTQRYAIAQGVAMLNDIQGFPHAELYPELAAASCRLVVMHAIQGRGRAVRIEIAVDEIWDRILRFFEERLTALERTGVARARIVLDPGMGFFLSSKPEPSLHVLANLGRLRRAFGLPVLVGVSRKSFLRAVTGRAIGDTAAATLAAELYAALSGADYIRTHEVAALRDGLKIVAAMQNQFEN